jgi:hypothetical protein
MATVGVSLAGVAFIGYLYYKIMLAGIPVTIPLIDVIISL